MTLFVLTTSCLKKGTDTIALPLGKIPEEIIPHEINEKFKKHMPINEGITPPNIVGEYVSEPNTLVYSSDNDFEVGYTFAPSYFKFNNQSINGMATYTENNGNSTSEAPEVYIIGNGNNFTAYFIRNSNHYDDYGNLEAWSKVSQMASGTITNYGISNYRYAFIMLDKYDPNNILMDINEFRVIEDEDGVASKYSWTKSNSKSADNKSTLSKCIISK